jgi:hypothetical protein
MKWCKCSVTAFFVLVILVLAQMASGAVVRISWAGNTESDLDGYKVYYGITSHQYLSSLDVGNSTNANISNLGEGRTYYFAVTAYDINGNESSYSQEVQVAIPEVIPPQDPGDADRGSDDQDSDPVDNTDPGLEPLADTDIDGIPDNVELIWGLNPDDPFDSLMDDDADGVVNLMEYMAGTDPLDPANHPTSEDILKDVIGEVGDAIDLSWINEDGELTFEPLLITMPEVLDDTMTAGDPGAYLYNAYDKNGALVYRVRVSVTAKLCASGSYEPGAPLNLDELLMGITLRISDKAILRAVPIGIGSPSNDTASAASYAQGECVEFELLPYGLVLAEPATVNIEIDGVNPLVQKYSEGSGNWEDLSGVNASDGLMTFSTQEFGKYRVITEEDIPPAGSGGGGCFISSACM